MWPEEQLLLLCRSGAPALFLPPHIGGVQGAPSNSLDALILLSEACVSSTFVFTQHLGALKRLVHRDDSPFINRRIKDYMSGKRFASLGLSHLHSAKKSMLNAKFVPDGIEINGRIPWVTGASKVDDVYLGARLDNGQTVFAICPLKSSGTLSIETPNQIAALNETYTSAIVFHRHFIPAKHLVNVGEDSRFGLSTGGKTGCALALGLAKSALEKLKKASKALADDTLLSVCAAFEKKWNALRTRLLLSATDVIHLRVLCNDTALQLSQSLLTVQRGAGFQEGMHAQMLCRQALFFLVWSIPQETRYQQLSTWSSAT